LFIADNKLYRSDAQGDRTLDSLYRFATKGVRVSSVEKIKRTPDVFCVDFQIEENVTISFIFTVSSQVFPTQENYLRFRVRLRRLATATSLRLQAKRRNSHTTSNFAVVMGEKRIRANGQRSGFGFRAGPGFGIFSACLTACLTCICGCYVFLFFDVQ